MHVTIGVGDYDLAMSKHAFFFFFFNGENEQNGIIILTSAEKYSAEKQIVHSSGERSWYY